MNEQNALLALMDAAPRRAAPFRSVRIAKLETKPVNIFRLYYKTNDVIAIDQLGKLALSLTANCSKREKKREPCNSRTSEAT